MNLKSEQRRLYELLPEEARCFVRVCDDDSALWVSDLPRKYAGHQALVPVLKQAGFDVRTDETSRLWYVDWTHAHRQSALDELPQDLPVLPEQAAFHEVYALSRLLLLHPAPLENDHLPMVRRVVKLTAQQPASMLRAVRELYEESAARLREGKTVAHAAGIILAAWLYEQTNEGKGTKP